MGSQYLVPCSRLPACAVPLYSFCLRWICNILSGTVSVHEHVPPCGLKPVCLTLCSRSSAVCLSLHSERHETLLAPGSGSTAASLGGSPSSSLSYSSSCCGRCGIGTSCCLDNMLHPVAPRRQGPWVPSPRTLGSLGPLPSCAVMPPTQFREFFFPVAVGPLSLWVVSPGVLSQPPASLGRFWGRRPFVRSTIARWQEATDPQSPEGGCQRACTHGGCPLHGFWGVM